ncbi:MAG: hypothetical protein ACFFCE_04875 [Promethearchaeota archaeon]
MNALNKSKHTMKLEEVLNELKAGGISLSTTQPVSFTQQPEVISAVANLKPPEGVKTSSSEEEWVDPSKKVKKEKEENQHILKPSDFFGP